MPPELIDKARETAPMDLTSFYDVMHRGSVGAHFLADIAPTPGRQPALADLDPVSPGCPTGGPPKYSNKPAAAGPCTSYGTPA